MAAVAGDIIYYLRQMLPLGLLALLAFLLLRPGGRGGWSGWG